MARLYANENFPLPVVEELRRLGHDVLTTLDIGKANQSIADEAVLAFATQERRAVLTINRRHFIRLHQVESGHCGVIVYTIDADFTGQAGRIDAAIREAGELSGKLLRVNRPAR
jgi:hypothetical protein